MILAAYLSQIEERSSPTCGDCALLKGVHHGDGRFFKCVVRGVSRSAATDHRLKWEACNIFQEPK
jgi:hypothetical protein